MKQKNVNIDQTHIYSTTLTHLYVFSLLTIPSIEAFLKHISWHFVLWNTKLQRHFSASICTLFVALQFLKPMLATLSNESSCSSCKQSLMYVLSREQILNVARHCIWMELAGYFKYRKRAFQIRDHWPDVVRNCKSNVCECWNRDEKLCEKLLAKGEKKLLIYFFNEGLQNWTRFRLISTLQRFQILFIHL